MAARSSPSCRRSAWAICSGSASQSLVDPSTSVNSSVTVPVGIAAARLTPKEYADLPGSPGLGPLRKSGRAEDQAAGRHAGAGRDQHRAVATYLVHRGAADLPHALGDAVHAVDVCLAKLAAVRVDREPPAELDHPVGDELPGLPARAEAELL